MPRLLRTLILLNERWISRHEAIVGKRPTTRVCAKGVGGQAVHRAVFIPLFKNAKAQQEAVLFIKQKLDAAKWFIDAVKQRNHTLFITMNAIKDYQKDYFLTGDEQKIKPMVLRDIASIIQMDISTVSRVANSKYVDTPYGTRLIKSFFSEGMTNSEGEDVSSIEIRKALETIIDSEDKAKPLTDEELKKALNQKGYPVARRTVAKYRDIIGAPVARLRKKL